MYDGVEANRGDDVVAVAMNDAENVEEATKQISQSLSRLRYRIDQSDAESGFVQTQEREFTSVMESETIRLNVAILDASTAEVTGEYEGAVLPGDGEWNRISFQGVSSGPLKVSWEKMLEAAQEIGRIENFRSE